MRDPLLPRLPEAKAAWRSTDPVLAGLADAHPPAEVPYGEATGFATMLQSLTHQQVSLAAGRAIWSRVVAVLGGDVAPSAVLAAGPDALRGAGLSRAKAGYFLDLAERTARGEVAWDRFQEMDEEAVLAELVRVKGIGPWTAKMFLMFQMHRPDVNVPEDVGLQEAVRVFYGVPRDQAVAFLRAKAAAWSPWNTLAARVLWEARRSVGRP